jgi:hypothetical protein
MAQCGWSGVAAPPHHLFKCSSISVDEPGRGRTPPTARAKEHAGGYHRGWLLAFRRVAQAEFGRLQILFDGGHGLFPNNQGGGTTTLVGAIADVPYPSGIELIA